MAIFIRRMETSEVPAWRGIISHIADRLVDSALETDALHGTDYHAIENASINEYLNEYDDDYDGNGTILLAIDRELDDVPSANGILAGFAIVKNQPDWNTGENGCIVRTIAVHHDYERQGIASILLNEAESIATNHGAKRLYVEHFVTNGHAADVYEHYGFKPYVLTRAKKLQ